MGLLGTSLQAQSPPFLPEVKVFEAFSTTVLLQNGAYHITEPHTDVVVKAERGLGRSFGPAPLHRQGHL